MEYLWGRQPKCHTILKIFDNRSWSINSEGIGSMMFCGCFSSIGIIILSFFEEKPISPPQNPKYCADSFYCIFSQVWVDMSRRWNLRACTLCFIDILMTMASQHIFINRTRGSVKSASVLPARIEHFPTANLQAQYCESTLDRDFFLWVEPFYTLKCPSVIWRALYKANLLLKKN